MSSISRRSEPSLPVLCGNERLRALIRAGCDAQAVVLCGPKGSGRHTAARLLAAAALCEGTGEKPCGVCRHCRKLSQGNHPDVTVVAREGKTAFKVEQARDLRSEVFIRPNEAECRVFIIEDAQDMNASAQNALLKVLEEPPAYARILLLCEHSEQLLPTVLSRSRIFRMEPLSPEEGDALLAKLSPTSPAAARRAAFDAGAGYVGAALALLGEDCRAETSAAIAFARAAADRSERGMFTAVSALEKADRDGFSAFLDTLTELFAAALEQRLGVARPGIADEAAALAASCSLQRLLALRSLAEEARTAQSFNVRPITAACALCAAAAKTLAL